MYDKTGSLIEILFKFIYTDTGEITDSQGVWLVKKRKETPGWSFHFAWWSAAQNTELVPPLTALCSSWIRYLPTQTNFFLYMPQSQNTDATMGEPDTSSSGYNFCMAVIKDVACTEKRREFIITLKLMIQQKLIDHIVAVYSNHKTRDNKVKPTHTAGTHSCLSNTFGPRSQGNNLLFSCKM